MTVDTLNPTTLSAAGPLERLRGRVHDLRVTRRGRRIDQENYAIDAWLTQRRVLDLKYRWQRACQHSRLGDPVNSPLGGFAMGRLPMVVHVEAAGYGREYLMVRLAPGQTIDELEDSGPELASGLGCWRLRFVPRDADHVRVELLESDPLARTVPYPLPVPAGHVGFGLDEFGQIVSTPVEQLTNMICQGATRSGKSAWLYQLLAQLAGRPDVLIAGCDPTGLVLRPFGEHPWRVWGTTDAASRYERAMASVVETMDRRIDAMPSRRDTVEISTDCPLIVTILEEWAAVARLVGHTSSKPSGVHKAVARLLAEGSKGRYSCDYSRAKG
jgi:S-DNA-T family DNA segregation ATPase FtsK/SpoIIIE